MDELAHIVVEATQARIVRELETENKRLRAALERIATDGYTKEDYAQTSNQPVMIWQAVARRALAQG